MREHRHTVVLVAIVRSEALRRGPGLSTSTTYGSWHALICQPLLPGAAQEATSTGRPLMGRFGVAAEPALDAHDLIDPLVTGADHLCELVGRVVACLENP
jgi:hypothetical protein